MEKSVIYDGRTFILGTAKRYYFATFKGKQISLHRYKYTKEVGPIPPGWEIHHKDKNYLNNDTDNLEALPTAQHYEKQREENAQRMREIQVIGKTFAKAWHGGPEGLRWHDEHYLQVKDKLHSTVNRTCSQCSTKINTTRKTGNAFCSNTCKSAWRRANKPDKKLATCPTCDTQFETLKYLPNTYCSLKCRPAPNPLGYHSRKITPEI